MLVEEENVRKIGQPAICFGDTASSDWRKGVSVIDDDQEVCALIRDVLNECDDMKCLDTYYCGEQALEIIPFRVPDVVLVDIKLPGISGLECIRRLRKAFPRLQIVVVTGVHGRNMIQEASLAGCGAYLEKPFSTRQLVATLRFSMFQKGTEQQRSDAHGLREEFPHRPDFTLREQEVMVRLSRGLLYKEIASEMGISFSLVHKLQNRMFQKLQARNRTEAVSKWERMKCRTGGATGNYLQ